MRAALLLLAACGGSGEPAAPAEPAREVVVYTSVDQVFSEPVLKACEAKTGLAVRAAYDTEETKSTGLVNRLVAEADRPRADVFWSNDPVRPYLLAKRGLVAAHLPPGAERLPAWARDAEGRWAGFAARARVLLVNTERLAATHPDGAAPASVRDLADPRWRGQAAMANPLFGTTTMHVAALATAWGDDAARDFLRAVKANGTRIASSNGEVKRLVVAGEVVFGLTDTDDAHEALAAGAPVRVVYPDQDGEGTLVMPTAAVAIRGGPHPDAAGALIDCLASPDGERALAASAAHMPLFPEVPVPEGVRPVGEIRAMRVDYAAVAETMARIEPWLRDEVGW